MDTEQQAAQPIAQRAVADIVIGQDILTQHIMTIIHQEEEQVLPVITVLKKEELKKQDGLTLVHQSIILKLNNSDEKTYYSSLRRLIRNGVRRADIGIRMKYLWMLNKFNKGKPSYIRAMKYNGDDEIKEELGFNKNIYMNHLFI